MARPNRCATWLAVALVVGASVAPLLGAPLLLQAKPYIVNHELRQCMPNPGIGLGGWEPAEACPEGYQLLTPQPPEKPWYLKLLELLDSLFGLSNKVVWVPKASTLVGLAAFILIVRRVLQVFGGVLDKLTHGVGPIVMNALISLYVALEGKLADGLTLYEVLEAVLTFVGTWLSWEAIKRLVRGGSDGQADVRPA